MVMKMRRFMSARESLADARIAYTLAAAVTAALIAMGLLAGRSADELARVREQRRLETLLECADSLRCYSAAQREDDRLSAALRFANAAVRLECRDSLREALTDYAGSLRYRTGGSETEFTELELADEFSLLAETGKDVETALDCYFGQKEEQSGEPDIQGTSAVPMRYLIETAEHDAAVLLGDVGRLPPILPCEGGFCAEAANLRLDFSERDGGAVGMVFIRTGGFSGIGLSAAELRERGASIARELGSRGIWLAPDEELCGYRMITAVDSELCVSSMVFDAGGRLWAFFRKTKG